MKMLDLFCGEGGATKGYQRAGFTVTGIDLRNTAKWYPGEEFYRTDALEYVKKHGKDFDFIHASPPCQAYSIATAGNKAARAKHVMLIDIVRDLLVETGKPYVIENVPLAGKHMLAPITLCGRMFGLGATDLDGVELVLDRHRLFESNIPLVAPDHPKHLQTDNVAGVYDGHRKSSKPNATPQDDRDAARLMRKGGYVPRAMSVRQELLGIDWMTKKGMYESIPPAYSEYIGNQVVSYIQKDK